jgi:hypothetical protein
MKTELTYLLEELDKHPDDKHIQVKDLKMMILEAFNKASKDEEENLRISDDIQSDIQSDIY